jgi:voltage-gated potassium channel Kch
MARRPLLAELHAHTTWSDGVLNPGELVDLYGSSGFDVLAITDHVVHSAADRHVRTETYAAYLDEIDAEAERARRRYGLLVVPGLELHLENAPPLRAERARSRRGAEIGEAVRADAHQDGSRRRLTGRALIERRRQGESTRSLNFEGMPESVIRPGKQRSIVERRIQRIINARSVTLGLAVTFIFLALIGGIVIRFVDHENFPSVGLGIWWALQTVTTVGYGDVVPTTLAGRVIGGVVMVIGIAFISFVTAGVTSALVRRAGDETRAADRAHVIENTQHILDELAKNGQTLADLEKRLEAIDSKLAG